METYMTSTYVLACKKLYFYKNTDKRVAPYFFQYSRIFWDKKLCTNE